MLGILYLILIFALGWAICTYVFPNLGKVTQSAYNKKDITVSPYILLFPAWFLIGTLVLTWVTYLSAVFFEETHLVSSFARTPLLPANIFSITAALLFLGITAYIKLFHGPKLTLSNIISSLVCNDDKAKKWEKIFIISVTLLSIILMWVTFHIKGDQLCLGVTVFSDFSPHLGMIRSFSFGNNFPTQYPHFAGEDIRYHFMFQFLVGNLEFLGLRIDYAFNIPSILTFLFAFMLLYLLAVKITGKIAVGVLSCLFFAFRSSKSLFTYLANIPANTNIWKALKENTNFIGDTPHEDWGLWNLNVYCNQRHLAFGLAVMFFILLLFLPYFYEMMERINGSEGESKSIANGIQKLKTLFLSSDGWLIKEIKFPIVAGLVLGSLGFFHGSAVIACLLLLAFLAVFSKRRLEFLITAIITLVLVFLQTHYFIKGSEVAPQFLFGFIAENKTLFGILSYLGRLLGILPLVLFTAFCFEKFENRWIMFTFSLPLILSFFISITVDVTVNHKYIMMSCILLGIYAAAMIMKMLEQKKIMLTIAGIFLIFLLTVSGFYDFLTVIKKNIVNNYVTLNMMDPTTEWVHEHSSSKDIFLTSNYAINQVVFGGAMLYQGWPYFAWSAGYPTDDRASMVKQMYEADNPDKLKELVEQNRISFIVVERANRESTEYKVNEENIAKTYQCVYTYGADFDRFSIYDTKKRK